MMPSFSPLSKAPTSNPEQAMLGGEPAKDMGLSGGLMSPVGSPARATPHYGMSYAARNPKAEMPGMMESL